MEIDNPFGEIMPIYHSPINLESTYSDNSTNIWKWMLAIFVLLSGFIVFLVWNEKNNEPQKRVEDKNKPLDNPNLDKIKIFGVLEMTTFWKVVISSL